MCGVAGIFAYHYASNPVDRAELEGIRDHMRSRGPDAEGLWLSADSHVGLAHRRLSIIDLDRRSNQPMTSADGSLVISFNGEIYNYRALRRELEALGCRFRTESDTEVLLEMYRLHGDRMFAQLRGMFAFALWDAHKSGMLLARDPYGIKPLYYADDGWYCRVASQVKALLASPKVSRHPEPAGIVGFYLLGSVPEPYTLYQEIRQVPAGCSVWVDALGAHEPRRFFNLAQAWADATTPSFAPRSEGERREQVRAALLDSVRHHLVADVPVGAFLSGGIDSGALLGLMRDAGQREIRTVTVAFDEYRGRAEDESVLAAQTARAYGAQHHVHTVTRREFEDDLPRILEAMDQPSIDGINTWFVAKATAAHGLKVAVSGLGGDELFGGYPSFRDVPRWASLLHLPAQIPGLGALFDAVAPILLRGRIPKARGLLAFGGSFPGAWFLRRALFMPSELEAVLDASLVREGLRRLDLAALLAVPLQPDPVSDFARVSVLESSLYMRNQLLRDTDWASMAHSLEVRVPLVDSALLQQVASCVAGKSMPAHDGNAAAAPGKALFASTPSTPLPDAVTGHAKTGFSVPVAEWIQQADLAPWRQVPELAEQATPWARRWSHVVGTRFGTVPA